MDPINFLLNGWVPDGFFPPFFLDYKIKSCKYSGSTPDLQKLPTYNTFLVKQVLVAKIWLFFAKTAKNGSNHPQETVNNSKTTIDVQFPKVRC